jgi:hypothetical protein
MAMTEEQLAMIRQLSIMIDLVEFQAFVGKKTRFGDKPGPEPWYYTKRLLDTYPDDPAKPALSELVGHFESLGAKNEVEAAMFIGVNIKHVP